MLEDDPADDDLVDLEAVDVVFVALPFLSMGFEEIEFESIPLQWRYQVPTCVKIYQPVEYFFRDRRAYFNLWSAELFVDSFMASI